jgi:hypothetical protein
MGHVQYQDIDQYLPNTGQGSHLNSGSNQFIAKTNLKVQLHSAN